VDNKSFRNILVTGVVGLVAFGSVNLLTGQDPAVPEKVVDIPAPADVAAPPADAEKTASGLASKVLKKGTGTEKPSVADTITIHYTGWDKTGKMFDSSVKRGAPATFPLANLIAGWKEGVPLMVEGEKRRFWIPADLAYGNDPNARVSGDLCFDIELIKIKKAPVMPKVPENVGAAPEDAEKSESGLASKVLQKGTGTQKPTLKDYVIVDFSAWTKDGNLFQSTQMQGLPASIGLSNLSLKGWQEGMLQMVESEKRRLWLPAKLAFGEKPADPRMPSGDICLDIELHKIGTLSTDVNAPEDYAKAPEDAETSKDGIQMKTIKEGKGELPTEEDLLAFTYTAWDKNGKAFDGTHIPGAPMIMTLENCPPIFKFAFEKMKAGEIRKFWVPTKLLIGESPRPGAPEGPFCFQFESLGNLNKK